MAENSRLEQSETEPLPDMSGVTVYVDWNVVPHSLRPEYLKDHVNDCRWCDLSADNPIHDLQEP